ncbi:MAG: galactose mutarotase [Deltaproteobacteria bacterium]|jgi:aldose 1-epimerase|nr:galactose mutarotase [Deltaproteobacteria bacterium]
MSNTILNFGNLPDGSAALLYPLENKNGLKALITNYGGIIVSLFLPDKNGALADVALGFDSLEGYLSDTWFLGAIIGRCAGRIKEGKLKLGGKEYSLGCNFAGNHIHGGAKGFYRVLWETVEFSGNKLVLRHFSPDGEENYPGDLTVTVTYSLTDQDKLVILYAAEAQAETVVNLTNHSYFNLAGHSSGDVLSSVMTIKAKRFTPVDKNGIPTGEIASLAGSSLDFFEPTIIGEAIKKGIDNNEEQMKAFGGVDQNYVLEGGDELKSAASLYDPASSRLMEIFTTKPGMQVYTANGFQGLKGKKGAVYKAYAGTAFEPQFFPDALNNPNFPSPVLGPGQKYHHVTEFRFSVR